MLASQGRVVVPCLTIVTFIAALWMVSVSSTCWAAKGSTEDISALAIARKTVFGPENDHLSDAGIIHKNPPSFTVGQTA